MLLVGCIPEYRNAVVCTEQLSTGMVLLVSKLLHYATGQQTEWEYV